MRRIHELADATMAPSDDDTLGRGAPRYLRDHAAAIAEGTARQPERGGISATLTKEAIPRHVAADAYGDIRSLFDEHGNPKPLKDVAPEDADLVGGYEVIIKNAAAGDGHTDTIHKGGETLRALNWSSQGLVDTLSMRPPSLSLRAIRFGGQLT
jgi:hypothetical protein